ncbi:hypothetical protein [Aliiroseovarius sp. YM-037]|uniref:hypothetical protein n=1 Tax=Aliiroseovarius sp. YM-037 TaxID=3341728 RepID=UPI003A804A1F
MTFNDALATQPEMIQLWVMWLALVMVAVPLLLMIFKPSRMTGLILLIVNILTGVAMNAVYGQVGLTRILGAVHIVFWVPLLIWLIPRDRVDWPTLPVAALWILIATLGVSLAFDVVDVIRYVFGDRASLIP